MSVTSRCSNAKFHAAILRDATAVSLVVLLCLLSACCIYGPVYLSDKSTKENLKMSFSDCLFPQN